MEKVYISRYSFQGEKLIGAIGYIDIATKTIYIPKVSKKEVPYIDEIKYDNFLDQGDSYKVVTTEKGAKGFYLNTYTLRKLTRKEVKA